MCHIRIRVMSRRKSISPLPPNEDDCEDSQTLMVHLCTTCRRPARKSLKCAKFLDAMQSCYLAQMHPRPRSNLSLWRISQSFILPRTDLRILNFQSDQVWYWGLIRTRMTTVYCRSVRSSDFVLMLTS